jgi:hypothetical protein
MLFLLPGLFKQPRLFNGHRLGRAYFYTAKALYTGAVIYLDFPFGILDCLGWTALNAHLASGT